MVYISYRIVVSSVFCDKFPFSDFPVYHTAFDTYDWMANYGDPSFHRHVTG